MVGKTTSPREENTKNQKCKYGRENYVQYWDKEGKDVRYECPHDAVKDGYCVFHHPDYWKENPEEIKEKFYQELKATVNAGKDIICIGYHLPSICINETGIDYFGYVNFNYCRFFESAYFTDATFKSADFSGSAFEYADFTRSRFVTADFTSILPKFLKFYRSIFEDIVIFKNRNFELWDVYKVSDDYWEHIIYETENNILQAEPILIFHQTTFRNPQNVTFIDFPLSSLSFLMTDVSNILLICDADEIKKKGILSERLLNRDEINNSFVSAAINTLEPHLRQETVLAEYRNIRKSFENNRTFAEASELFIREMRMLRKSLSFPEKFVHWAYDCISRYGESFLRPLAILIGSILAIPIIENYSLGLHPLENYLSNVENTARLFLQLPTDHKYGA